MRACRTARRGIFRFKFSYCDRGILLSRLLKALAAQDFHEDGCGAEFALQRKFNPAARKFLLCSVKNLLRCETIKFTARFGVAAKYALRRACFAGQILRRAIKFKMKV